MFEIIKRNTHIDFVGFQKLAYILSGSLLAIALLSLLAHGGPRYGIDFAGGFNVQVRFEQDADLTKIRTALSGDKALSSLIVQNFDGAGANTVLLHIASEGQSANDVREAISKGFHQNMSDTPYEIQQMEMVGPKVGADLREKALQAIFYAILIMATYISGRFEQRWGVAIIMAAGLSVVVYILELLNAPMTMSIFAAIVATLVLCAVLRLKYALGAVISMMHDVLIPLGVFSLLNKEVDLTILAAFMTIVGYSLNDTIIIYDRIRENLHDKTPLKQIINKSINQTLSRTLITSITTFAAVLALYILGGGAIHDLALTLLIGIIVGTYSSIYVAAPMLTIFKPRISEEAREKEQPKRRMAEEVV